MSKGITRRAALSSVAKGAVMAGAAVTVAAPWVRNAKAATLELRWLGWEHYNVKSIVESFEKEYGASVSAGFFDGNSEAYNKLSAVAT
jgi:spermidine/putrescine-binding protein